MATILNRKDKSGKVHHAVQIRMKGHAPAFASFERLTDARKWAVQTEAAIREGRYFTTSESQKHTLGEAIDRYVRDVLPHKKPSSIYSQTIQLTWWKERLGCFVLADITPPVIAESRDALLNGETHLHAKRSNSTVVRYMAVLSHLFTVAMKEWGWVDDSPMRRVSKPKEPRGRVRFLSDDERARLLIACKESRCPYLYPVVVLALSTGMRKMEMLSLTWADVDLGRAVITLQETKNGERRAVPLVGHAFDLLQDLAKTRRIDTPMLFPAPFRHGYAPKHCDIQSAWDWAVKRAELTDFRFHDLRHSAASYLAMNGASLAEIAEVLGHKTLQMVKRYAHLSHAHTSRVVASMNAAIFAKTKEAQCSEESTDGRK